MNDQQPQGGASNDDSNGKNRRGAGSKSRQAERFRKKRNKDFDSDLIAKLETMKLSLGYSVSDLFGPRRLNPVVHPSAVIKLNTDVIGLLCDEIATVLHQACRVPGPSDLPDGDDPISYDAETLKYVSAYQVDAKLYYSQCGSVIVPNQDIGELAHRVSVILNDAIVPLSIVLDQIGQFELDGQRFIPTYSGQFDFAVSRFNDYQNECRAHFIVEELGVRTNVKGIDGHYFYATVLDVGLAIERGFGSLIHDQFVFNMDFLNRPNVPGIEGVVQFTTHRQQTAVPPFMQVVERYVELKGRVNKKLANVFVTLNIGQGKGCMSQLTYIARIERTSLFSVWSPRKIGSDALEIGAVLGLGYVLQTFADREIAQVETVVETAGALMTLANVLTRKMLR